MGLGAVYEELGKYPKALLYIKKAVDVESINSEFWYILGDLQHKLMLDEEALQSYGKVCELDPSHPDIWLDISEVYFLNDSFETAISALQKGMEHQPGNYSHHYRMATYLFHNNQIKESLMLFGQALSEAPEKSHELFDFYPELSVHPDFIELDGLYNAK
jgi:tetratricopeptide (TPR) repeat protein